MSRKWIDCPICGGTDNSFELDADEPVNADGREVGILTCTNLECGSNGGSNFSAVTINVPEPKPPREDALGLANAAMDAAVEIMAMQVYGQGLPRYRWEAIAPEQRREYRKIALKMFREQEEQREARSKPPQTPPEAAPPVFSKSREFGRYLQRRRRQEQNFDVSSWTEEYREMYRRNLATSIGNAERRYPDFPDLYAIFKTHGLAGVRQALADQGA